MSEKTVSALIREKRQRLHMTQKELADATGLGKYGDRTIRRWENGETEPKPLELKAILQFPESAPFPNKETADYRSIDLFAGIGGTRLGFVQTGRVKVVFSSEFNPFSVKTYRANFGEEPSGDITKIDAETIPDHDILVGGFPCQAFSMAGLKRGFEDTRGTLFFDVARIIRAKRPKAFMLENVKNLMAHDKGKTFSVIRKTLEDLGYAVNARVLDARKFGVPQHRERIYIVGFDKSQVRHWEEFEYPNPPCTPTRLGDILEPEVDSKYTISDRLWQGHQRRKKENKLAGKGFGYGLFTADSQYANTISARYYKDGSEILIEQKGKNPRKITPREAARLQGFPEEFIIPVSDTQAYKQFGNSVAVPVVHAVANELIRVLDMD
ncbi:DNA (cytosine-5-)-methyltransferase [Bifidobacterium saguini]|nr:DNA (cytosine-5-)-methyltransferase [Bifidobacterium saguini]QTB90543.1 DNA (cytosine-5-)-methyltransferase [Bifidobacterium saguini]